jgi:hypothetical protein
VKAYYDRVCREELERLTSTEVECMRNIEGLLRQVVREELERVTSTEVKCMTYSQGLLRQGVQGGTRAVYPC